MLQGNKSAFLSKPSNLLYPFTAGVLVCASQLKNDPTGIQKIPFMNLAKVAIGVYALSRRVVKAKHPEM